MIREMKMESGKMEVCVMDEAKWYFTSNGNGVNTGLNDGGINNFAGGDPINHLIRETIQNSLDAVKDKTKPVMVEFKLFDMDLDKFPKHKDFHSILEACYEHQKQYKDAESFFARAKKLAEGETLPVLRISDFNTIGLEGADTNSNDDTWGRLVKGSGVSNQGATAGGSYGIGKSITFGCSDLRTVFYAGRDRKGIESCIGVARLVTFADENCKSDENPNGLTTGTGYYANSKKIDALLALPHFDSGYTRTSSGTDIYIMGMRVTEHMGHAFIERILENFLVSLWDEKLIVHLQLGEDFVLNKSTMEQYIEEMVERRKDISQADKKYVSTIQNYYEALTKPEGNSIKHISLDPSIYGEKYGFKSGDAILYIMKKEDANRRILITRNAGMKLFDMKSLSGAIEFTGILRIVGETMSEKFRKMETPAHDEWVATTVPCRDNRSYYENMYKELKKYIKNTIIQEFQPKTGGLIDAFGVGDLLPDKTQDGSAMGKKETLDIDISRAKIKISEMKRKKSENFIVQEEIETGMEDEGGDETHIRKEGKKKKKGKGKSSVGGKGNTPGLKLIKMGTVRGIAKDPKEGKYILSFHVLKKIEKAVLAVNIVGEQGSYDVGVKRAEIIGGMAHISEIEKNRIYLENLKLAAPVKMEIEIDFDRYCRLEVSYYEAN